MPPMSIISSITVLVHEPWATAGSCSHSHPTTLISSNRWPVVGKQWKLNVALENGTASVIISIATVATACICADIILTLSELWTGWHQHCVLNIETVSVRYLHWKLSALDATKRPSEVTQVHEVRQKKNRAPVYCREFVMSRRATCRQHYRL